MWLDVFGFEGVYQVSDQGEVRSLDRLNSRGYKQKGVILSARTESIGYKFVTLYNGDKKEKWKVHRLVAKHFVENPKEKPFVNHINGIKDDNRANNLEWVTAGENKSHSFRVLKERHWMKGKTGTECRYSKIVEQLDEMGNIINRYGGTHEASRKTGISQGNIASVCRGERKSAGGYIWQYFTGDDKNEGEME